MLVRNVKAGESCQLRKMMPDGKYRWTTIRITKLDTAAQYCFLGAIYTVQRGYVNTHSWGIRVGNTNTIVNHTVKVSFTGRTHGSSYCIGVDAPDAIGIQWDGFKGSLRTGKVV